MVWKGGRRMIKKFVYVTFQKEFIHQYIDAPTEVEYLRYPHRHIAHITVKIEVFNNDREIEFIMLKHWLEKSLEIDKLTNRSCETIAETILAAIQAKYGKNRDAEITVSEDNENGAVLIYTKEDE